MNAAVQLDDVAVSFGGVHAVDGVTISIAANEFVGLIGPNGAGKTTLISIVAGKVLPAGFCGAASRGGAPRR